ncbi:hypothetical protein NQD34_009945, partial [Periophthalmus magnuspinnatus]
IFTSLFLFLQNRCVTFLCLCVSSAECWTDWFDRDDPSGTGDYETLPQLRSQYPGQICTKPLQIQVETKGGVPLSATGDVIYKADTVSGFICRNADQKKGRCRDYKVRFMCPLRFCVQSRCWTQWFDRDDPSGTGDWETLASLHISYPEQICAAPLQIQAQTTTGLPAIATGNTFASYDTTVGLICKNAEQKKGTRCHDFQVRFLCPPDFCRPKGCFTEWFDRDDPSGSGDWETLFALREEYPGHVCNSPLQIQVQTTDGYSVAATGNVLSASDTSTGFVCKNADQNGHLCEDYKVRFRCPEEFCESKGCWTEWFDRDNPSGKGDWENLELLLQENPGKICEYPLQIEVQTTSGNSVASTGNVITASDPNTGFICENSKQPAGKRCEDFKVRFFCPEDFCKSVVDPNGGQQNDQFCKYYKVCYSSSGGSYIETLNNPPCP